MVSEAGDSGDSFYVVDQGSVRVLDQDRVVRTMVRGEGFGEIALLGRTTRTMTVRAVDDARLCGISSDVFIPALTSMTEARAAAEATRRSYLGHSPGTVQQEPDPRQ